MFTYKKVPYKIFALAPNFVGPAPLGGLPKSKISASSIHTNILQEVISRLLIKKTLILSDNLEYGCFF